MALRDEAAVYVRDLVVNRLIASAVVPVRLRWRLLRLVGMPVARCTVSPRVFFGGRRVQIGPGTFIGHDGFLDATDRIVLGSRCNLAMGVLLVTSSHHVGPPRRRAGVAAAAPISVGDGAWLGARVTVLPGVRIGAGAIIAAGSVVTADCEPDSLYAGVPAIRKGPVREEPRGGAGPGAAGGEEPRGGAGPGAAGGEDPRGGAPPGAGRLRARRFSSRLSVRGPVLALVTVLLGVAALIGSGARAEVGWPGLFSAGRDRRGPDRPRPGPASTGVPPGTKLAVHTGDLVITRAGAHYDALDIRGFVDVRASGVTISRSIIRGGRVALTPGGNRGVVTSTDRHVRDFVLEDSTIAPDHPSPQLDGVTGGNFTLRRVEITGGVDGVKVFGDNVRIVSSWLHGNRRFDDPYTGQREHGDGVQVLGGSGITILGSRIEDAANAGIMVSQDWAATTGLVIRDNWLDGGGCTVNIVAKKLPTIGPVRLVGNRFGPDTAVPGCQVVRTASTVLEATGNVLDGSGAPVRIRVWN